MQERLPLLAAHVGVGIAQHKPDSGEEVTLSRSIAPNDDIGAGGEGLDYGLLLVAVERSICKIIEDWQCDDIRRIERVIAHLLKP
jgi:hypothetical protein